MIGSKKLYVVVNTDLKMSVGKTAAQVAHAVARINITAPKIVIVLGATTEQIHNLDQYMTSAKLKHHLYIDEGVNEVPPMSATALAFGNISEGEVPDFIANFQLLGLKSKGFLRRK